MKNITPNRFIVAVLLLQAVLLAACSGSTGASQETAAQASIRQYPTPQGRVLTANQGANTLSLIDVATGAAYGSVSTGQQPHHVVANPGGSEFWVSLYAENRVQVFDAATLQESGSVDVGDSNDDLVFDPSGKMVYVSLGKKNAVAVVDATTKKLVQTVPVGKTPHGVKVSPDGKFLLVTNTADNTVSVLSLGPQAAVDGTIRTGANPFEVTIADDNNTAYVSNFLGDSISVLDVAGHKSLGFIRSGKQPAMIASGGSGQSKKELWVANTGSSDVWVLNPDTRKLVTRVPVGGGAHGVVVAPDGKVFVTNSSDNTVSVIDSAAHKVLQTVPVGSNPNGLTYLPNVGGK